MLGALLGRTIFTPQIPLLITLSMTSIPHKPLRSKPEGSTCCFSILDPTPDRLLPQLLWFGVAVNQLMEFLMILTLYCNVFVLPSSVRKIQRYCTYSSSCLYLLSVHSCLNCLWRECLSLSSFVCQYSSSIPVMIMLSSKLHTCNPIVQCSL